MKKDWIKILIIFIVVVGMVFWGLNYLFLNSKTAPKSKASGYTIELSYDPATPTVTVGQDLSVTVRMKSSYEKSLRGYYLRFPFNKTKLQLKSIEYKLGLASSELFADTNSTLAAVNQAGVLKIQGEIQNPQGYIIPSGTPVELVNLVFTALTDEGLTIKPSQADFYTGDGNGTISFMSSDLPNLNINGGQAPAICTNLSDGFNNILATNNWGTFTNNNGTFSILSNVLQVRTPASPDGTFKSSSVYTKKLVAGDFTAEVLLQSTSVASGSGYVVGLGFFGDPFDGFAIERQNDGRMRVLYDWSGTDWVTPQIINTSLSISTPVKVKLERLGTTLKFYHDLLDGAGYHLDKTFSGGYVGSGKLSLYVNNTAPNFPDIMGGFDNFELTCITPTGIPTPTPTGGTTGNVRLNLKLKFQGISKLPATGENSMTVKVKVQKEGEATSTDGTGTFVADANGLWTGTVGINQTNVTGKYRIMVKGPQHIQKKICDSIPTETNPGTYHCSDGNISLVVGDNNLNFSGILLLSGDLDQNGIVDSVDFGLVRNNLGKTDAATLVTSDINRDGRVDSQDYSLIISALSVRTDEL